MDNRIKNLSIRGRIVYLIMCFEKYVLAQYPERNWRDVSELMWKICDNSDYIDNNAYRYMEIIPEYLYEFDNYKDAEFDYLSEEDYKKFISIIPADDADLEILMHNIYNVAMEYAYTGIPDNAPDTIPYIQKVESVMNNLNIELPDLSLIDNLTDPKHWWGKAFDGRYLSSIL